MNGKIPHIVQYQGSKRKLAPQILQYMPQKFNRLIEPFSGVAALSIATAYEQRTDKFYINDINVPLINMFKQAVTQPQKLSEAYTNIWNEQFSVKYADHVEHFYAMRERFNSGEENPAIFLYLLARCVKGAVRYGKDGKFNQSPDKRRHGTKPHTLAQNIYAISQLLNGKAQFSTLDYRQLLSQAQKGDLVYLDPPYQGVSKTRDNRYLAGISFNEFANAVKLLDNKGIDYLISYDGKCGNKAYGKDLPNNLHCQKIMLNAGLSTQSLLLGKKSTTFEALYISKTLLPKFNIPLKHLSIWETSA